MTRAVVGGDMSWTPRLRLHKIEEPYNEIVWKKKVICDISPS